MSSAQLHLAGIKVALGGTPILHGVGFSVPRGSFACLLGPSGCGKSTLLRTVAGFLAPDHGRVTIGGECVSHRGYALPPERRRVGMVFQEDSLFPHLDVSANVAFGIRSQPARQRRETVEEMLQLVGLAGLSGRYPHELSGGQQQRVALARALAPAPTLVLLDEPFSGLDGDLRERLGLEVREILRRRETTALMVTHDQQEAFALSDLVGVMHHGAVLQWDSPYNLYHQPADRFVASFVGQSVFLPGTVAANGEVATELGMLGGELSIAYAPGVQVDVLLRPDDVMPADTHTAGSAETAGTTDGGAELSVRGRVRRRAFRGAQILYSIELEAGPTVLATFPSHHDHALGDLIEVRIATDHLVAFPLGERQ